MRPIKSSVADLTTGFAMIMLTVVVLTASVHPAAAQSDPKDQTFARLREMQTKLSPKAPLSSGARNLFALASNWDKIKAESARTSAANAEALMMSALMPGLVSAPPELLQSRLRGFIANESSTAWCRNHVVIGFNDTESLIETSFSDFIGYSVSTNKGASFTDKGFPTVPSDPTAILLADQVMTCTSENTFYFSSLYESSTQTAVSVSASSDGGQTFGAPVIAASASNGTDFFDADWMAVNPSNPQQLFVTYTDEDFSGFSGGTVCPGELGTSVKMVSSSDGGNTWGSSVTVANEVCIDLSSSNGDIVEFSQVAVDPRGTAVYVAWESFSGGVNLPTREIDIAASALSTISFGGPVKISSVNYAGGFDSIPPPFGPVDGSLVDQIFQGRILAFERPILAIGKGSKNTGVLYVTWNDGDNQIADLFSGSGFYHFTDVFLTSSGDGGNHWSTPVRVNNNAEDGTTHPSTDQFHPTVASDKTGRIGVCFYDRRNDPLNFLIGRTCAVSTDAHSWTNLPIDSKGGPSLANQDPFGITDWLGDYETLATDSLNQSAGFIGGYTNTSAGYQNIRRNMFSSDNQQ